MPLADQNPDKRRAHVYITTDDEREAQNVCERFSGGLDARPWARRGMVVPLADSYPSSTPQARTPKGAQIGA